jgi:hypothetical protein
MRAKVLALALVVLAACDARGPGDGGVPDGAVTDAAPVPTPCASTERAYHDALERLGGCPYYLYRDEWCRPSACDPNVGTWWVDLWTTVPTCRDLYWSRGAYCGGDVVVDAGP